MSISDKLVTIAENEQKVHAAGAKSEYDRFWDDFQGNGGMHNYCYAFGYNRISDVGYNPKHAINCTTASSSSAMGAFYNNSLLTDTKVPFYSNGMSIQYTFGNCTSLKTIREVAVTPSTTYGNTFTGCTALENITFSGTIAQNGLDFQWSTKLSRASIESIIAALSTTTSGKSITLSATAVRNAYGASASTDLGTYEPWTSVANTRRNWEISVV